MSRKILTIAFGAVVLVIISGAWYFSRPPQTLTKNDLIKINNFKLNQTVKSPLTIKGEARGAWYFEGSFPIKIFDGNNSLLGVVPAQAKGEWMTEAFVPFEASLIFSTSTTKQGTLVLQKDNPSGLPENDDEFIIPVTFKDLAAQGEKITVKAFFNNSSLDPEYSCNKVFPIERTVDKTQATARAALEELLKGVSTEEESEGYFTSINPGVKINRLVVENGTAEVDFDGQLEFQVGGSCRVSAIRSQITQTLKQFPTVENVVISIDGRTEDILQP
ncbi:MAG: GerMN domain-containing protein [Candidatus Paceibacterota bacterium]